MKHLWHRARHAPWNQPRHWLRHATLIFLLAFFLRLCFAGATMAWSAWRQTGNPLPLNLDGYEQIAANLIAGRGFSSHIRPSSSGEWPPNLFRAPVYPFFLAGLKACFGGLRTPIFFANAVLGALTAALLFGLATHLISERAGWTAGILASCDPMSVLWSVQPRPEILLALFSVAGFCLLTAGGLRLKRGQTGNLPYILVAASGLLFGLAALTKPVALFLAVAALPLLWRFCRNPAGAWNWRSGLWASVLLLATWSLLCGTWVARNFHITQRHTADGRGLIFFSTLPAENRLVFWATPVWARAQTEPVSKEALRLRQKAHERTGSTQRSLEHASPHLAEDLAEYNALSRQVLKAHPWLALQVQMEGRARIFFGPGDWETLSLFGIGLPLNALNIIERRGLERAAFLEGVMSRELEKFQIARARVRILQWGWLAFLYSAALWGIARLWRAREETTLWIAATGIVFFAVAADGPEWSSRFRVVLVPFVALLASAAAVPATSVLDKKSAGQ